MKYPIKIQEEREVKRITIKQSFTDFLDAFNVERGMIYTIKMLFLKPGYLIRSYLAEGRYKIMNAFRLLLITTAISLFIIYFFGFEEFLKELEQDYSQGSEDLNAANGMIQQVFIDWYNLLLWIAIPIYALFTFLLNKRDGYNFAEHIVLNAFYISAVNLLSILIFPFGKLVGMNVVLYLSFSTSLLFFIYILSRFLERKNVGFIIKNLVGYILANIIYAVLISLLLGIIVGFQLAKS